jgi:hypothetical protein
MNGCGITLLSLLELERLSFRSMHLAYSNISRYFSHGKFAAVISGQDNFLYIHNRARAKAPQKLAIALLNYS